MRDLKRMCGALPCAAAEEDYSVKAAGAAKLPERYFNEPFPVVREQKVSSCVAHAVGEGMEQLCGKRFGPGFVYGFRPEGKYQGIGMIAKQAVETARIQGNVLYSTFRTELEMPEMKRRVDTHMDKLLRYARKRRLAGWARCRSAGEIKTAVFAGMPVIFCAAISQAKPDRDGVYPCKSAGYGYHEMLIVGWGEVRGKEYFRVQNSWGKDWGEGGFCWISPEDVLREDDAIALSDVLIRPEIRRTLKLGLSGEDVKALEQRLSELGFRLDVDGVFDEATREAVKAFQKQNGIAVSGTVGTRTWNALEM